MPEVFFYHLTSSPLEQTLPQLLERTMQNNWRVLVRSGDAALLPALDERLWGGNSPQFLPHGIGGGKHDADQPILLTSDSGNANGARALMLVHGAKTSSDEVQQFDRVSILFNGNDAAAVDDARAEWKILTDAGVAAKYWSQASGRWEMKAEKNTNA
jgi:DNA polymerase-3 subunit chi